MQSVIVNADKICGFRWHASDNLFLILSRDGDFYYLSIDKIESIRTWTMDVGAKCEITIGLHTYQIEMKTENEFHKLLETITEAGCNRSIRR